MASVDEVELSKLKVAELKKLCKEKGLPVTGNKSELLARLRTEMGGDIGGEDVMGEDGEEIIPDAGVVSEGDVSDGDDLLNEEEEKETPTKPVVMETGPAEPVTKPAAPKPAPKITKIEFSNSEVTSTKTVSEEERIKKRAERFGIVSAGAAKSVRAARFGITESTTKTTSPSATEAPKKTTITAISVENTNPNLDKLKSRAERFGAVISTTLDKATDVDKLKQRAERFGAVVSPSLSKETENERILKRKERFGAISSTTGGGDVSEAKRKRAERFGLTT